MPNPSNRHLLPLLHQLTRLKMTQSDVAKLNLLLADGIDWPQFINQLELHGLSGLMLHHAIEHDLSQPQSALLSLKALALRHRGATDARHQLMQELSARFDQAGIGFAALKGLALAPIIYPQDALRPMRDIDILVAREQEQNAARVLREMGFDLPSAQPSRFMRGAHQLPNATKTLNGYTVSVEVHHDALAQDVPGHLLYEDVLADLQIVHWREIDLFTLGHEQMLHQLCRHLAGLHPGGILKLINVLDVVLYSEQYFDEIDWERLRRRYAHVLNTLKCVQLIVPLSPALQAHVGGACRSKVAGVGEIMQPLTQIINAKHGLKKQLALLFTPPDWWLHLYYNADPDKSLVFVKLVRHPINLGIWFGRRLYSRILGG